MNLKTSKEEEEISKKKERYSEAALHGESPQFLL
jgi:hypothetical protein